MLSVGEMAKLASQTKTENTAVQKPGTRKSFLPFKGAGGGQQMGLPELCGFLFMQWHLYSPPEGICGLLCLQADP